jgi:enoyl-CoA hydratase
MDMSWTKSGYLDAEIRGSVLIVRLDGGQHALMGVGMSDALADMLDCIEQDAAVTAVIFTGKHPERFIGHADVRWLQEGGKTIPRVGSMIASAIAHTSKVARAIPPLAAASSVTPLNGGMQLDKLHDTFLRMNRCGIIFIAALNGSALGLGCEFAQVSDMRLMADGNFFIGQPEILLGINPGGGGTQRLTRLVGSHRALMMMLEGRPVTAARALEIGLVDELVPPDQLIARAVELAEYLGSRPRGAIAAIKRAVYFGGSMPLDAGLHLENAEFIMRAPSAAAQELMLEYLGRTDENGDLPFYNPAILDETLKNGSLPLSDKVSRK